MLARKCSVINTHHKPASSHVVVCAKFDSSDMSFFCRAGDHVIEDMYSQLRRETGGWGADGRGMQLEENSMLLERWAVDLRQIPRVTL